MNKNIKIFIGVIFLFLVFLFNFDNVNAQSSIITQCIEAGGSCMKGVSTTDNALLNCPSGEERLLESCYDMSTGEIDPLQVCCKGSGSSIQENEPKKPLTFTPEVGFPGFQGEMSVDASFFGNFVFKLFQYLIYLSGVVAVIAIMIAGFQWVSAGGNQSKIGAAKQKMTSAIIGVFLVLSSVLILGTINPDLINIKPLELSYIEPIEDNTEAVPIPSSALNESLISIPQHSNICTPAASQKTIGSTAERLLKVADCMKQHEYYIEIASSYRTVERQAELYKENCGDVTSCVDKSMCKKTTCCPFKSSGSCPHTSGVAFDAYAVSSCSNKVHTKAGQKILQECMFQNDFCLLASSLGECWHFESPKMSNCKEESHMSGCNYFK